jgi:hypothetical protein
MRDTGKIAKLVRLLASDKPGEVIAAVAALKRALQAAGHDLHDLADAVEVGLCPKRRTRRPVSWSPPAPPLDDWQAMAWFLHFHRWQLREEQRERVADYLLGNAFHDSDGRCRDWHLRELRSMVATLREREAA